MKEYKTAREGNKIKVKKEIDTSNEAYDFASLMSELSPSLFEEEKNTNSFFNVWKTLDFPFFGKSIFLFFFQKNYIFSMSKE